MYEVNITGQVEVFLVISCWLSSHNKTVEDTAFLRILAGVIK